MSVLPPRVVVVLSQWRLDVVLFPLGAENRDTKTYIHTHPQGAGHSIIRMVSGTVAAHAVVTPSELAHLVTVAPSAGRARSVLGAR